MDVERFRASPIGSLVRIQGEDRRTGVHYDHFAYLPEPLGAEPVLSNATWRAVSSASRALGRLQQGTRFIPNPALLRQPTLRREAQSTSALEGTFAPLEQVLAADVIDASDRSLALTEILNFVEAAETGFGVLDIGGRVTTGLLCQLHGILVRGTAAETGDAGRVREIQVAVGSRSGRVEDARYVPMPPGPLLAAGLQDLVDWITETAEGDPIVAAAMAHYQFESIHPFNDGNGRIGRLLIVLQLLQDQVLSSSLLSVSPWFETRRDAYQDHLAAVGMTGDWDPWVRFFAEGIENSAVETASRIERVLDVQESYQVRLRDANIRGIARDIAQYVVGSPFVDIPALQRFTGKTYQAASDAVSKLVGIGILEERDFGWRKVYRAPEIVAAYSQ